MESGGLEPEDDSSALQEIENVGAPLFNGRERILGGTSHRWTGRTVSFDDIDYEARSWVPFSGWPFGREAIALYLDRASSHLGAGVYRNNGRGPEPDGCMKRPLVDPALLRNTCWEFARTTARFGPLLRAHNGPNMRILLHATVTHLNADESGTRIESVEIAHSHDKRAIVKARTVVLCAGGVENARILLYSNRVMPNGIGNHNDVVGRYFMDHPRELEGIVRFDTRDATRIRNFFGPYLLESGRGRNIFEHGFTLSPVRQREYGLLNCAAWPDYVVSANDPVDAIWRLIAGPRNEVLSDMKSLFSQPRLVLQILQARLRADPGPAPRKVDRLGFVIGSEQIPDPESRIELSERRDRLGLPLSKIDWRIHNQEKASQAALAQIIASEFKRLGLPAPHLADWVRSGRYEEGGLVDACHPTGATRMADNPRYGVVDSDCQVHGVAGLYVAGSSTFPTGGHANPTLMIVAFAVRLAHHLKNRMSRSRSVRAVSESNETRHFDRDSSRKTASGR